MITTLHNIAHTKCGAQSCMSSNYICFKCDNMLLSSFLVHPPLESKQYFEIPENVSSQLLPYNYESIMHLPCRAYTINGLMTVVPKEPSVPGYMLQDNPLPHELDYLHLNILYCNGEC